MRSSRQAPVLLVSALAEEVAPLAARIAGRRPERQGRALAGRLSDRDVLLLVTGAGEAAARRALATVLATHQVSAVVGLGVAGGLSPGLAAGDVVLASEVRAPDGRSWRPDGRWLARAVAASGSATAMVVGSRRILATASDKRRLYERTGSAGPAVVDLESAVFAGTAARHGLPWLVARAVSDAAATDLPLDFDALRAPDGRLLRRAVALEVLRRPRAIGGLARLARVVATAARDLAELAPMLLPPPALASALAQPECPAGAGPSSGSGRKPLQ